MDFARARRRWRSARLATLPLIRTRLSRAQALQLAHEPEARLKQRGHASYLRKLQLGSLVGGIIENQLLDVRVNRAADEAAVLVSQGAVVTSVASEAEVDGNEKWRQGDATLATRTKFEQRFRLRHAPVVNNVLHVFWTSAVRSSGGADTRSMHSGSPGLLDVNLRFEHYFELFSRVFRILIDDYDEDDARSTIEDDFRNDSKGDDVLTNSEFCDALFELADMWVEGIDAGEYADWLWRLYRQIGTLCPANELRSTADCVFDASLAPQEHGEDSGGGGGAGGQGKGKGTATDEDGNNGPQGNKEGNQEGNGRKQLASKAKARKGAATQIQAVFRRKKGKRQADERGKAAVKLQAARRGQLARRQAKAGEERTKRDRCLACRHMAAIAAARPPPPPPPPKRLRPPPPLPPPLPPLLAMSFRCDWRGPTPATTADAGSRRRYKMGYSRALQQGYPFGHRSLVSRQPPALGCLPWASLPVARRGRSRQEPVFSHVLPHSDKSTCYHAVGLPGPRPGFQHQARWRLIPRQWDGV